MPSLATSLHEVVLEHLPVLYSTFLEVLEQEAEDRRHRRINRLRRESRLPSGKTWETPVFTGTVLPHDVVACN